MVVLFSFPFFFGFRASAADAANLYFSPTGGTYSVGESMSFSLYVSSKDQAVNAGQGFITFPNDLLEVASLSKSGSIFTLWTQEPSYSNSAGTIHFEGILFDPGYTGGSGKLLTVNFRVKAPGSAIVEFSSGSVLANDGEGTNIVSGLGAARLTLVGEAALRPPLPRADAVSVPFAPVLSSPTHPDPEQWYALNTVTFQWPLPQGVTGVNILADREPATDPGTKSDGLFSSYTFEDVDDGIWYIHVRLRNQHGWGPTTHQRFQIDTTPPSSFIIERVPGEEPMFFFKAESALSGISRYEIAFKGPETASDIWTDDGSHIYIVPTLKRGEYAMNVKAVDRAGNFLEASTSFESKELPTPVLTQFPQRMIPGDILTVGGTVGAPDILVRVWLEGSGGRTSFETKSDAEGRFEVIEAITLEDGIYRIWAESYVEAGKTSDPSDKKTCIVGHAAAVMLGRRYIGYLSVAVPMLGLILLDIWYKLRIVHRVIRRDLRHIQKGSVKAFMRLKKAKEKQIRLLDRVATNRDLTKEEKQLLKYLHDHLAVADRFLEREAENLKNQR